MYSSKAARLESLYLKMRSGTACRGSGMSDIFVPGRGALGDNAIVFIGEAPGRSEEEAGMPFVGAAGKNLNLLLAEAAISRNEVFITNIVKYRPISAEGKNRNPSALERRRALPFLLEELEVLKPRLAVCLGLCPARALLGGTAAMSELNGGVFKRFGMEILVTYHPSPFNFMIEQKRNEMIRVFRSLKNLAAGHSQLPVT